MFRAASLVSTIALTLILLPQTAPAQTGIWTQDQVIDFDGASQTSAHSRVGPFEFDFFCGQNAGGGQELQLSVQSIAPLGGRWGQAFETGGFDGRALVRAGDLVVGEALTQASTTTDQVVLTFTKSTTDMTRLMSGGDLNLGFEDADGSSVFDLSIGARGLGAQLCPVANACGRDVASLCSIFTAVQTSSTVATPLADSLPRDTQGNPRWFKSQYQTPQAALPYHRTASIFDADTGAELHISCLAEDGGVLALNFLAGAQDSGLAPFADVAGQPAELLWETGDAAGRWTQFSDHGDGHGLGREGMPANTLMRATLEELMTTNQPLNFIAQQGSVRVMAEFTAVGSRDAICPVMNGCDISLGFSPACASRQ